MTQVLSTLNRLEQSRFEAFRRSTLPSNAVSSIVAHNLLLHNEHLVGRQQTQGLLLGASESIPSKQSSGGSSRHERPLHDLVAPGHADSIVVVVTSLAKAYAQRLVAAARRVASAQGYPEDRGITVEQIQQAQDARLAAGLDPGFFLQSGTTRGVGTGKLASAALGKVDRHDMLRQAALEAQEEYDRYKKEGKTTPPPTWQQKETVVVPKPKAAATPVAAAPAAPEPVAAAPVDPAPAAPAPVVPAPVVPAPAAPAPVAPVPEPKPVEPPKETATEAKQEDMASAMDAELESDEDETSLGDAMEVDEAPLPPSPAAEPKPIKKVEAPTPAPAPAPAAPKPAAPSPPKKSSGPMSMEDALLNDLDDSSSDDDD